MTQIKAFIFDLGGVLVEFEFEKFFNDVIKISPIKKPGSFLLLEFWRQSDTYHQGLISDEEFYHQACELLQICALTQEQFFASFNSVLAKSNEEMISLLKKLREKGSYKLICLSNINRSHWEYLNSKLWNVNHIFDELILSFQVHLTKPDPKIFELAIQKAGCKPEEIIYIDDGLNNVRAASNLKINAITFTTHEQLIEKLKKFNIEI
ncbi:MAG: HAD family hydrolase [Promethearchaeota archaeon]